MSGIDVVIPARNAAATLPACLDALVAAGLPADAIRVVDDGSTDRTADIARARGIAVIRTPGQGAAMARNTGAAGGRAPVIFFVDADVALHGGAGERVRAFFDKHPDHAGLLGSYDADPPAPGTLSRVRNLLHCHTHRRAAGDVTSFWGGIGAIRRADFEAVGGFRPRHRLEDVALGLDLARAGRAVRLDPDLQGAHLKRWTLASMVRADLFYRALPWSRMLLDPQTRQAATMLSADRAGKISVLLVAASILALLCLPLAPLGATLAVGVAVAALAVQNRGFLTFVNRRLGPAAAVQAVGVLWLHFLCAGTGFALACLERISPRSATAPSPDRNA